MTEREQYEKIETDILSPFAAHASKSLGRVQKETPCRLRTCYQRDRDRILHCKAFRRLKHKTQVFLSPEGDHYRTRLTHTLEVSQIARTIARGLRLNEDLVEAVALGHDLGHTPFGHAGEKVLDGLLPEGFKHYEQSLRVVDILERGGRGLNLSREVRDGILCHTTGTEALTVEGRIVRLADKIAYMNHDIDDAVRANVISEKDIPDSVIKILGDTKTKRITTLIYDLVDQSHDGVIRLSSDVKVEFDLLHDFMYESVYHNPHAKSEEKKIPFIIQKLFGYYQKRDRLPDYYRQIIDKDGLQRAAADYVSGMTDPYAIEVFRKLYIPKSWNV